MILGAVLVSYSMILEYNLQKQENEHSLVFKVPFTYL